MTQNEKALNRCLHMLKEIGYYDAFVYEMCAIHDIEPKHLRRFLKQKLEDWCMKHADKNTAYINPADILHKTALSFTWTDSRQGQEYWKSVMDQLNNKCKKRGWNFS